MASEPASPDPGRDDEPKGWQELPPSREDWLTEEEWVARVSSEEDEE